MMIDDPAAAGPNENPMKTNDYLLLGLKNRVTALSRTTGGAIWTTVLPGGEWGMIS